MKKSLLVASSALTLVVLTGSVFGAEKLKSGPQVGEKVPGPFEPLNINGEFANQKKCQFCINGTNPVAMVFARECSEPVKKLIKELDAATVKNSDANMGSFFVFLSDDEGMEKKLQSLAKKDDLKKTVLTLDNKTGPEKYNIAKDADVTVVLYKERKVVANYAFKKGQMKDKDVDKVLADLPKILSDK
ncbi:MAG TPA: hypothetical protein VKA46_39360 [Gemmataceae bacterium]|nr:hypothetical protein [Gemmataceae bacterium]